MLTDSLPKTKLIDPFILSLVEKIGYKRSLLDDIECIDINPEFSNIVGNKKGNEFYIENQFHKARGFRKLHVEVAEFSFLKILHCVFFPDPLFDIPIFGLDLVKKNNIVSAAIVDLSPVSREKNTDLSQRLKNIKKEGFSIKRKIPDWGDIFSENVFFASLVNEKEYDSFSKIVDEYLTVLVELSKVTNPDQSQLIVNERIHYQKKYCSQQMKNEKTSFVLLRYFEKAWVDKYIKEILFDF